MSCLTTYLTTQELGSQEIRIYWKISLFLKAAVKLTNQNTKKYFFYKDKNTFKFNQKSYLRKSKSPIWLILYYIIHTYIYIYIYTDIYNILYIYMYMYIYLYIYMRFRYKMCYTYLREIQPYAVRYIQFLSMC